MKKTLLCLGAALGGLFITGHSAFAQSTQFTYQGVLQTNGVPYSGSAEFEFVLWDAASGGNAVATNNPTSIITNVVNGLFTVALDFGMNPFTGDPRFLEVDVRTVIGPFNTLTPRQPLTATPYALRALNLTTNGLAAGTYTSALSLNNAGNAFTGTFTGDGSSVTNVNAITLGGVSSSGFWSTDGNVGANPTNGAFVGTADNLPLELRVNGQRAFRLEPTGATTPNVIGGSPFNFIQPGSFGSVIAGGGGSGNTNAIISSACAIGGGTGDVIFTNQNGGVIAGGTLNAIGGSPIVFIISPGGGENVIGGGINNAELAGTSLSAIGGGYDNTIGTNVVGGTIGGGNGNGITANATYATIPGGQNNSATNYAFAAGHRAKAITQGSFVWADAQNLDFSSTSNNQFLIRASGGVGIGTANPSRELEIQDTNDVEIGLKSTDTGGHLWTIQSSSVSGSNSNLDASFQIFDRTISPAAPRFYISTNGNVGIGTTAPTNKLHVIGGITCTALSQTSDRNAKENFEAVSPADVLAKVSALPITTWNYKEMRDGRHLGPMAQDFYAAFKLGGSDTSITAIDTEGVALAAIQGLNEKLLQESKAKDAEIEELKARLEKLERVMDSVKASSD